MEDTEALLRSAIEAHDQGRGNEALQLYTRVLQRAPHHVGALFRFAMLAYQAGRPNECAPILEKAAHLEPGNAEIRFRLGHVLGIMGRLEEAICQLERAVELAPHNFEALLKLGVLYLRTGNRENALAAFQRAVVIAPQMRHWLSDPKLPGDLRKAIGIALGALQQKFAAFAEQCLEHLHEHYPGEDLSRLEAGIRELCGGKKRPCTNPKRRPALLNFPELPERPWFERDEFDWVERVESAFPTIRDELQELLATRAGFKPYCTETESNVGMSAAGTDFSSLAGSMMWNALHLYRNSYRFDENCARCPGTVSLMESLPTPRIRNQSPEVFFSCLQPGGHIIPHHGLMNVRLTVHLGLIVPEGCALRAGGETRSWEEGRLFFFDDSYEHEAWNRGTSDRVVLIFEAWNPALSNAEKAGIEHVFKLRRDWLDRFDGQCPAPTV